MHGVTIKIKKNRCAVFLIIYGLEDGVSGVCTVGLLDCGVGSRKSILVVGYLVAGCEVRIISAEDRLF